MWSLALAYAVHLLSTVMWLGSVLSLFDLERTLPQDAQSPQSWLRGYRMYMRVAWMAGALLWATGMFQMSQHPLYEGTLNFSTPWAKGLLFKHLLVLSWAAYLLYLQLVRLPQWERIGLEMQRGGSPALWEQTRRALRRSFRVQQILALLILAVTAWLRAQM